MIFGLVVKEAIEDYEDMQEDVHKASQRQEGVKRELRPQVGVGVAVFQNEQILLGRRKGAHGSGDWGFPGGHLEFGEKVEECAHRELSEETGLKATSLVTGPWINCMIGQDKHYISLIVFVNAFEGDLKLLESEKCEGWQWFPLRELPSPLFPPITSLIEKIGIEELIQMGSPQTGKLKNT